MTNLKAGTLLENGKYRIEKVIGQGGFGITYLGEQINLGRRVAIKEFFMKEFCNRDEGNTKIYTLSQGSSELVERFRLKFIKEARNLARLRHPNIVSVIDVFEDNETAYYVMEYHEGGSLADKVKNAPIPEADAVKYIRQIASALDYVHSKQMMHLDVKPANILLDAENNAILIDFGLAKQYDNDGRQTSTTPIGISHGYAPMEQYKNGGVSEFSPVSDIYSLGATLYKLVTGLTPPEANDVFEAGLPNLPATLSPQVCAAIEKSMQPRRANRPQNIGEFLALIDEAETKVAPAPAAVPPAAASTATEGETMLAVGEETQLGDSDSKKEEIPLRTTPPVAPKPAPRKVDDAQRSAEIKKIVQEKKTKSGGSAIAKIFVALLVLAGLAVGGYFVWKYFNNDEMSLEEKMALMDEYDGMSHFDENGLARVWKKNGEYYRKYGFIDKEGNEVIPCEYDYASYFNDGLAYVNIESARDSVRDIGLSTGYEGFINTNGERVLSPSQKGYYDFDRDFADGMIKVYKDGKYGFMDKLGNVVIPCVYDAVSRFNNGRALAVKDERIFFIDELGHEICFVRYCTSHKDSYVKSYEYGGYFMIYESHTDYNGDYKGNRTIYDAYGNRVLADYDKVSGFDYDEISNEPLVTLFRVENHDKWGVIDGYGNVVVPFDYDAIDDDVICGFSVVRNGKAGCLDFNGNEVIPCEYDNAMLFSDNLAFVVRNDKCGIVNANNKIVVPIEYDGDDIHPYFGIEMIKVTSNGNTIYYDFEGNQVQR